MKLLKTDYLLFPFYEHGLLIDFKLKISNPSFIIQIQNALKNKLAERIIDFVPAYHTLLLHLHQQESIFKIIEEVNIILTQVEFDETKKEGLTLSIPVCFEDEFSLDKKRICDATNKIWSDFVDELTQETYSVYMLGFIPGFAYLGMLKNDLHVPRHDRPRKKVLAGSVAVAESQTGIYPSESPGGWNIVGKTPIKIFDILKPKPSLFEIGNCVKYVPISRQEYDYISMQPEQWKLTTV